MFGDEMDNAPMGMDDKPADKGGDKMAQAKALYEQLEDLLEGMGKDPVEFVKEQAAEDESEDAAEGESDDDGQVPAAASAEAAEGDKDAKKAIIVAMLKKKMKG